MNMSLVPRFAAAKNFFSSRLGGSQAPAGEAIPSPHPAKSSRRILRLSIGGIIGVVVLAIAYLVVGEISGTVNNTDLTVTVPNGGNSLIATMAGSIERELDNGWCPTASILSPSHVRYDICGFQEGEQLVMIRMAMQAANHLTRQGSASSADPDMTAALNAMNRGNKWSPIYANSTVDQYRQAVSFFKSYNQRLSQGGVPAVEPRIDTLSGVIADMSSLIGDESTQLRKEASEDALFSMRARTALFHGFGVLAAVCQDLKAIETDFATVIKLQSATEIYHQAVLSTCATMGVRPFLVVNGEDFGLLSSDLRLLAGYTSSALNDLAYVQNSIAAGAVPHGTSGR
jgi:hypothetical protein